MFAKKSLANATGRLFSRRRSRKSRLPQRALRLELLESRELLAADIVGPLPYTAPTLTPAVCEATNSASTCEAVASESAENSPWHNATMSLDVNDDGYVSPLDALLVINDLNTNSSREVSKGTPPSEATHYIDVNDDGFVSPIDALQVINSLNASFTPEPAAERSSEISDESAPSNELITTDLPLLTISDTTIGEPLEGKGRVAIFKITLNHAKLPGGLVPEFEPVTVSYATKDGSAIGGSDFKHTSGTITFDKHGPIQAAPAYDAWTREVLVPILADRDSEQSETFTVELSSPLNATLMDAVGQGTILNTAPSDESAEQTGESMNRLAHATAFGDPHTDWLSNE